MKKRTLAFLSKEASAATFHYEMLKDIFEDEVMVEPYIISDKVDSSIPIVLISSSSYYSDARLLFPNSKIISGEKTLSGINLEKIALLPAGKKVIVINTPIVSAIGTIENLLELGFTHLEYIPFLPGDTCPDDVYAAISPGLLEYCPHHIDIKIDLGFRIFSIDAFNRLFQALNLNSQYLDKAINQIKMPILLNKDKLVRSLEKEVSFYKERELIINKIPDAVLMINANQEIVFLNKGMEGALGKSKNQLIGKNISEVLRSISKSKNLLYNFDQDVSVKIFLNNYEYQYNCISIDSGHDKQYMFTFKLVEDIKALQNTSVANYKKYGHIAKYTFEDLWGDSEQITELKKRASRFAKSDVTILISGESGTGKEILAQAIHNVSSRKEGPFLAVNFAAIPENLIEAELFGYEGGSFTGAKREGKAGYFEMMKGGTIFIDEIGDMPLYLQSRLLRLLQEREVIRVGGSQIIPIDVRVIAATNVDLKKQVSEGKFRQDLYFRLNVLSLSTIPLRQFKASIYKILQKYLWDKYSFKISMDKEVSNILHKYDWPGNIRELQNIADYMYYAYDNQKTITLKDIPPYLLNELKDDKIKKYHKQSRPYSNNFYLKKDMYLMIIKILLEKSNHSIGRNSLKSALEAKGIYTTEYAVKKLLKDMCTEGYLAAGKTKQGTCLTEKAYGLLTEL